MHYPNTLPKAFPACSGIIRPSEKWALFLFELGLIFMQKTRIAKLAGTLVCTVFLGKSALAATPTAVNTSASTKSAETLPVESVRIISMKDARQPFDMAAKLQWNPHDQHWDKVLVLYNGAANPPQEHPVWKYLSHLSDPKRHPSKPGENIGYQSFKLNAYCEGTTPLSSGKAWVVNFNQNQLGLYGEKDHLRDWNCPDWTMGLDKAVIVNGALSRTGKDQSMRIRLPRGLSGCDSPASCVNWKPLLGAKLDSLYYSYWVKFPQSFEFVMGGKLPGIGSFNANSGGAKPSGHDGWSIRAMWNLKGQLGQYVYHMDQPKPFGEFFEWDLPPIVKDKWYHIKTFVKLNAGGQKDGIVKTWVDGKVVLDKHDLRFRAGNNLPIERFLFSLFYGGSGPEWAPPRDMDIYFDDFVLSSSDD